LRIERRRPAPGAEEEPVAKAVWNGLLIAESEHYELVENNVYFPCAAVKAEYLEPRSTRSRCPWKGEAHYYTLKVAGRSDPDAAWYYPDPKPEAARIKDHIAFWKGVAVMR
jgi:uncharacterized protein (DUF427 family)